MLCSHISVNSIEFTFVTVVLSYCSRLMSSMTQWLGFWTRIWQTQV